MLDSHCHVGGGVAPALPCPVPDIPLATTNSSHSVVYYTDTVTVTCDQGYELNGTGLITCGHDQMFDQVLVCQGIIINTCQLGSKLLFSFCFI